MSSLNSALRQETAFVYSPQPQRTLTPPWASQNPGAVSGLYSFTLQSVGGAVFLQDCVPGAQPERGIHWQIENSVTGTLHLTEFTVHGGAAGPRVTVDAAFQLFPALAATGTSDGRLLLAGLLSNGYLLYTQLRLAPAAGPILAGLSAEALRPLDLTQHLAPLGTPTSLAATPEAVLVGGSNGSVLCIPLSTLEDGNTSRCFDLRDSSWAFTKLIPGVLYRPRQPAALACVPVTLAHRQLLLVSYDDSMLRVYNVARRQQVATLELEAQVAATNQTSAGAPGARQHSAGSQHLVPTYITAESPQYTAAGNGGGAASAVTLVVQFEAADTLSRHTYAYTLSSSSAGRLALANRTELAVEPGGVVSEARVSGDTVWLLIKSQGRAKVLGYDRSSGSVVSSAMLAEAAGEHLSAAAGTAGNGAEVDQELWEWLLQSFPEDLSAEGQVCQQVLVPGQTCRASLRDALSYHGAQYSSTEVDQAPHVVLKSWIQAAVLAVQRRTPSASAPECWQSFLTTYRAAWARRHPPLGLVLHRGSPEWLGLARGGAVLCVLRRGTVVEALHGADAVGPLELPPHLNAVHRCAVEAGALLGPLVQEACLALLVAGVDPRERLVPQLSELWHCGPAAAGGGWRPTAGASAGPGARASSGGAAASGTRAAALTDSAREAQQRWRQRRQQLIIATGQRLGALSDPAGAVDAYLRLLRLLISQTSSELAAAAHGGLGGAGIQPPSRAAAAFLVSTCRQVSRAAAAAARDAALLLGLIAQQGALGTAPVTAGSLARLDDTLLNEACELLRRSALGLWLTGTPSSQDEAADMEPALSALRHLRLGGGGSPRVQHDGPAAAAQQAAGAAGATAAGAGAGSGSSGDTSLAARLLPAFCAAYTDGRGGRLDLLDGAEAAGLLFTLYLQYGEQPGASLAARVLQLGYQLFQAGEYGNLAELAALAGATGSSEAGPQFLRGLGITCALALERQGSPAARGGGGMAPGTSRRAERIAEAAGCFFRAAASLASDAGDTLRIILGDLRAELAGGLGSQMPPAPAAASAAAHGTQQQQQQRREVALLQLHFCEAVMQLFERERAPEGAVMFAEAALGHLRAAYGPAADATARGATTAAASAAAAAAAAATVVDAAAPLLPGEEQLLQGAATAAAAERAGREGRLWSNVYSYYVEMRQYDRAYTALLANPLPAARLQSLRHLVHVLAQEGQLQTLCTLPLAGVAVLPVQDVPAPRPSAGGSGSGRPPEAGAAPGSGSVSYRTVSLLSEALDLLHRRAHNCDLSESPQPYQVLYDFLVCRGDFKGAARAMAAYAWRLRAEAPSTEAAVAEALRAYDLAISCLSLLEPKDAWLDLTDPWVEKLAPHNRAHSAPLLPSSASAAAVDGLAAADGGKAPGAAAAAGGPGSAGRASAAAGRGGAAAAHRARLATGSDAAPVATLQSLQRERTMLHYCAMVAARVAGLEPMRQWDNEDAILRQLLLMGRYEGALALVAGCYGAQGGEPWVKALEAVVSALAAHCTRLQLQDGGVPTGGPALPPTDLFVDDPDGDVAASGLGAASAAAVAATLGGRAAPLWAKLRQLLLQTAEADAAAEQQGGGVRVAWLLRDAAAEAVLRTDPRVDLPQWLLDMFLAEPGTGAAAAPASMGSWACGPASLLSLYLRHDRLAAAVELVSAQAELWSGEDVLKRRRHCAAWMPYPQLELLHTKLTIAQQLGQERSGALLEQLNAAVAAHLDLVGADTEGLQGGLVEGPGGDAGPVRPPLLLLGPSPMGTPVGTPSPMFGMGMAGGLRLFGS
ncbi:hypothetical protein PLESTB_000384200 [Pleodorina starrii]|uniref:Nuclear pore complex protein Nup160 n=1 Tax=Pleodorina starrii TaxID=330485 RepID=A0A9W6BE59_9CHLO|nr:hypothetical protein PLESTM_000010700 [Pleodorina starrii]GLC50484.1 hypothetical protein PLESTB_000384200 [Pleodorina starrii]GLC73280.1 hypothetical protein PLESTF_001355900 [Pleodorina starrii]